MDYSSSEMLMLVGLVVSSFVATNLDNLLLLVVLLGANAQRRIAVLLGFLCSAVAVLGACALGIVVGSMVGAGLVGYLGIVPVLLGCHMLYKSRSAKSSAHETTASFSNDTQRGLWLSTFFFMFGNSGDSIAVFLPLLAESGRSALLIILGSYLVMALSWAGLAYVISGQRGLAERIERHAVKFVPWIMIGVGIYILMDTATDTLL